MRETVKNTRSFVMKSPFGERLEKFYVLTVFIVGIPTWSVILYYLWLKPNLWAALGLSLFVNYLGAFCATKITRAEEFNHENRPPYKNRYYFAAFAIWAMLTPLSIVVTAGIMFWSLIEIFLLTKEDSDEK